MWVDVVCLRRDGLKLPPDEVRATAPLRALLTMDTVVMRSPADGEPPRRAEVAQLWTNGGSDAGRPLGVLECARVSRIGGTGLLIVGVDSASGSSAHPQAWWCRVILADDDGTPSEAAPATDWHDTWPGLVPAALADTATAG